MIRRPGKRRSIRRVPAALVAGLAIVFAVPIPLGGGSPPTTEVLGALATPAPAAPSPGTDDDQAAVAALAPPAVAASPELPAPPARGDAPPAPRDLVSAPDALTGYAWPIRNARLTLPFGPSAWGSRIVDGEKYHDGIDLATFCGDRITAAHDGVVLAAGRRYDEFMGWQGDLTPYSDRLDAEHLWITLPIVIITDDGNGYRSIYAHFRKVVVKPGDVVRAGDLLGYEGATGRASGCHLHYGLFSPEEASTFGLDAEASAHMLLPPELTARIDPLLVLPPPGDAGIR